MDIRDDLDLTRLRALEAELASMWPCRALRASKDQYVGMIMLSVIADNFDGALMSIMEVSFPGFTSIAPPFLCSSAKVAKSGAVVADMVDMWGHVQKDVILYMSETHLRNDIRRLADQLDLTDAERVEMFAAVRKWVVADRRLDPTMDPQDPDAKRLVH